MNNSRERQGEPWGFQNPQPRSRGSGWHHSRPVQWELSHRADGAMLEKPLKAETALCAPILPYLPASLKAR